MIQQSELQQYLHEQFKGKDKTRLSLQDEIFKTIKESWNEKLGYVPLKPMALISVHDKDDPNILTSLGCSEPNDIITNIFGAWFAPNFNGGGTASRNLTDLTGVVRTMEIRSNNGVAFNRSVPATIAPGCFMQVGRGGSGVLRSDFQLSDPFVVAPEANPFPTSGGGWIEGNQQVVADGLLSNVTTSDTIGECGLICEWFDVPTTSYLFLLSHDISGAAFSSGQNINVTYTWSIT